MNVLIIQPPIVQLNTAYPSGAYLSAFFKRREFSEKIQSVKWLDLSIELFYAIFSKAGLTKLFSLCSEKALKKAAEAERNGDEATAFNLRRYVSTQKLWTEWIDDIVAVLRPDKSGFENAHRFVFGAHVPRGSRMETFLENLDHDLSTDDARSLASLALADLADFIAAVLDKNFSLVRYAESLTVSESTFDEIAKGADSPPERILHSDSRKIRDKSRFRPDFSSVCRNICGCPRDRPVLQGKIRGRSFCLARRRIHQHGASRDN